jgi:hypothetical protein
MAPAVNSIAGTIEVCLSRSRLANDRASGSAARRLRSTAVCASDRDDS